MSKIDELRLGFETAYIDGSVVSSNIYRPQFVSNSHKEGKKVLSSIEDELLVCDGFQISVAFITMNGITPLLQTLKVAMSKTPHTQYLCMFARHGNLFYHSKFIVTTSSKWYN